MNSLSKKITSKFSRNIKHPKFSTQGPIQEHHQKLKDVTRNWVTDLHPTPSDTKTIVKFYSYTYGMVGMSILLAGGVTYVIHRFSKDENE